MRVLQPGLLTLIQDAGRYGKHRLGLTNGGPLDPLAFRWANRLCGNDLSAPALEISIGALVLESQVDTCIALCGAQMPLKINGRTVDGWRTLRVAAGDKLEVGIRQQGARAYLAVTGGWQVVPVFSSAATVMRESLGGLSGTGSKLEVQDFLPCQSAPAEQPLWQLAPEHRPDYSKEVVLRTLLGYQQHAFDSVQQRLFFTSDYQVTDHADRMGYRLSGQPVLSGLAGILSEGICHGAVQVPADGQPIVLLNDRQTIGGYPKIGSVLAQDTARLAQCLPGDTVRFEPISMAEAHNLNCLAARKFTHTPLQPVKRQRA